MDYRQHNLEQMFKELHQHTGFTRSDWQLFEPLLQVVEVEAGHVLQPAGTLANTHHFVIKGLVRFYYLTPEGKELNKAFYAENHIVGSLSSVILNEPSRFSIATLEPCTLAQFSLNKVQQIQDRCPSWDRLFNYCCRMMLVRNERREAELLTLSAKERFLRFVHNFPGYLQRIPQYHIASYLGITPVALSKYKNQWLSEHAADSAQQP